MGTQETLCCAPTQARHSHHNQSRNQNQNENTSNNRRRIEENNNGPYRQRFRPQNSHNGNTYTSNIIHTTATPRITTTKQHQTTKDNSQNTTAVLDRHIFPPLFHHRNAQLHNVQTICTMLTTTTNTHMKMKTNSIRIIMTSTTPTITRIPKTPTTNP